jgi:hypothetical protein
MPASINFNKKLGCIDTNVIYSEFDGETRGTFSFWFKLNGSNSNNSDTVLKVGIPFGRRTFEIELLVSTTTTFRFLIAQAGNGKQVSADIGNLKTDGLWHHILFCADFNLSPDTDKTRLFLDGLPITLSGGIILSSFPSHPASLTIGGTTQSNTSFVGNLDEVCLWAGQDLRNDVATIYNNGKPADLTGTKPTSWYRAGENSTFSYPQILMPEDTNKDKVSKYSLAFDGTGDYIDCGTGLGNSQGTITAFSVSMWIKPSVTSGNDLFFNIGSFANSFGQIAFQLKSNKLYVKLNNGTRNYNIAYTNTTAWQHLVFVYDGSNSANTKMYLDNVEQSPTVGGVFPSSLDLTGLKTIIGAGYSISYPYAGLLDEVSYFNTTLSSSDVQAIYNNNVPNDISSYSPVGYWKLGEEAKFTDNWLVPNSALSNFSKYSFNFDGVDDEVSMDFTNTSTTGSISVWVKPTDYTTGSQSMCIYTSGGYRDYIMLHSQNTGGIRVVSADNGVTQWDIMLTMALHNGI